MSKTKEKENFLFFSCLKGENSFLVKLKVNVEKKEKLSLTFSF